MVDQLFLCVGALRLAASRHVARYHRVRLPGLDLSSKASARETLPARGEQRLHDSQSNRLRTGRWLCRSREDVLMPNRS